MSRPKVAGWQYLGISNLRDDWSGITNAQGDFRQILKTHLHTSPIVVRMSLLSTLVPGKECEGNAFGCNMCLSGRLAQTLLL